VNIKLEQLQLKQEKCEEFIFNYRACYMLDKIITNLLVVWVYKTINGYIYLGAKASFTNI